MNNEPIVYARGQIPAEVKARIIESYNQGMTLDQLERAYQRRPESLKALLGIGGHTSSSRRASRSQPVPAEANVLRYVPPPIEFPLVGVDIQLPLGLVWHTRLPEGLDDASKDSVIAQITDFFYPRSEENEPAPATANADGSPEQDASVLEAALHGSPAPEPTPAPRGYADERKQRASAETSKSSSKKATAGR